MRAVRCALWPAVSDVCDGVCLGCPRRCATCACAGIMIRLGSVVRRHCPMTTLCRRCRRVSRRVCVTCPSDVSGAALSHSSGKVPRDRSHGPQASVSSPGKTKERLFVPSQAGFNTQALMSSEAGPSPSLLRPIDKNGSWLRLAGANIASTPRARQVGHSSTCAWLARCPTVARVLSRWSPSVTNAAPQKSAQVDIRSVLRGLMMQMEIPARGSATKEISSKASS